MCWNFVSLDSVIQASGGSEEDTSGGFAYGQVDKVCILQEDEAMQKICKDPSM
jgi:hypothetical protein